MITARPTSSDGKGRDAGKSITARVNVSRAKRGRKITLPVIKFLDNHETDDQTDGPAQAGGGPPPNLLPASFDFRLRRVRVAR
jgi:hypothetical protein